MRDVGISGVVEQRRAKWRALFVSAMIRNGGNATQAAVTAGFSPKTARQQGQRLLTDVDIADAVRVAAKCPKMSESRNRRLAACTVKDRDIPLKK